MAVAFNIVLNFLLIAAMALFAVALGLLIMSTQEPLERALRAAAVFCGALVVLGAQAAGVSYSDFIVKALADNKTLGVGFLAAVVPAAAGVGVGWYFVHSMKKSDTLTIRLLAFVGMLALASFASVYVAAFHQNGVALGAAAVPNISFAVSLLLYVILKIDIKPDRKTRASGRRSGNVFSRLATAMGRDADSGPTSAKDRLR
jgi:hypothetical protein